MAAPEDAPTSPDLSAYDPWLDDEKAAIRLWHDDAERLFSGPEEVRVKVIDVGINYHIARDEESLAKALVRHDASLQIILIPQEFSWGSLLISATCMRIVLQHLSPFPAFLEILHTFGQRTEASNETRGRFDTQHNKQTEAEDHVYLLKCVEKHGREGTDDPWSLRQFAVYEQHDRAEQESRFLVVNPSASRMLRDKLVVLQNARQNLPSRMKLHVMMLSAAGQNWAAYVDWLEGHLHPLTTKAYVNAVPSQPRLGSISRNPVDMTDMQSLQLIQDKLHETSHLLSVNESVALAFAANKFPEAGEESNIEFDRLNSFIAAFRTEKLRVKTLLGRAASVSALMQNLMSTRALETLHESSNTNARIAKLAQEDNKIMLALSAEGRKDGRTLKTITILTLAYLPASFVSTLLSMGYVYISGGSLHFKPEMAVFGVLTVILLLITFGLWFSMDLRLSRREAKQKQSEARDFEKRPTWGT